MGYTHYWYRPREIPREKMEKVVQDYGRVVAALKKRGLPLADYDGKGSPVITAEEVRFNGRSKCGHRKNSSVVIPWPKATARGSTAESERAITGAWFAGVELEKRTCDGSCDYESVNFPRVMEPGEWQLTEHGEDGPFFACCKTAFRPYDLAVTAFLLIALHHGAVVSVSTDGEDANWADARNLVFNMLGYGATIRVREGEVHDIAVA